MAAQVFAVLADRVCELLELRRPPAVRVELLRREHLLRGVGRPAHRLVDHEEHEQADDRDLALRALQVEQHVAQLRDGGDQPAVDIDRRGEEGVRPRLAVTLRLHHQHPVFEAHVDHAVKHAGGVVELALRRERDVEADDVAEADVLRPQALHHGQVAGLQRRLHRPPDRGLDRARGAEVLQCAEPEQPDDQRGDGEPEQRAAVLVKRRIVVDAALVGHLRTPEARGEWSAVRCKWYFRVPDSVCSSGGKPPGTSTVAST